MYIHIPIFLHLNILIKYFAICLNIYVYTRFDTLIV